MRTFTDDVLGPGWSWSARRKWKVRKNGRYMVAGSKQITYDVGRGIKHAGKKIHGNWTLESRLPGPYVIIHLTHYEDEMLSRIARRVG